MNNLKPIFGINYHLVNKEDEVSLFDVVGRKDISIYRMKDNPWFGLFPNEEGKLVKLDLGLVILYMGDRFHLPIDLWDKVTVEFLDDDKNNYSLDNLYVMFPEGGIEHSTLSNWFYIPGLELNLVNRKGDVRSLVNGKVYRKDHVAALNKGYVKATVDIDNNTKGTRVLHRLLALAFLNPPKDYPKLVVNHIDGNKTNFNLDNLEWTTYAGNNQHAVDEGLKTDNHTIVVYDKETKEESEWGSLTSFARHMGCHPQYIVDGKNNTNQTFRNRWIIKDSSDERPWSHFESIPLGRKASAIKARNVLTGEVLNFRSTKQASKELKISQNGIAQYFKNFKGVPAIVSGYEWKLVDDETPWHEFSEYEIEIFKRGLHRNTVVYEMTDTQTGEKTIMYGNKPITELTGICKRRVILMAQEGTLLRGRYKLEVVFKRD